MPADQNGRIVGRLIMILIFRRSSLTQVAVFHLVLLTYTFMAAEDKILWTIQ
jgi:hypothetical protein